MNKTELINEVSERTSLTKKDVTATVDSVIDVITDSLKSGEKVQLIGFGSFEARKRAARKGRNPQTGDSLFIPESRVPTFKAGKALREAVKE